MELYVTQKLSFYHLCMKYIIKIILGTSLPVWWLRLCFHAGVSLIPGGEGATIPVSGSVVKNNFFIEITQHLRYLLIFSLKTAASRK